MENIKMSEEKKIVLGGRDNISMHPIKYEYAYKYFLTMDNNIWSPHSIEMLTDSRCYTYNLTAQEKHMFENSLAYLSTADVVAMRNVGVGISERITAVEVEMVMANIAHQESIHTMSYQHILDSCNMPGELQGDIYSRYKTVPTIKAKIDYSSDIFNKMLMSEMDTDEGKFNFLHGYWYFSQIFEGCLFIGGFNPIFSLDRRGKMSGSAEQLEYIKRDEEIHKAFGADTIIRILKEDKRFKLSEEWCIEAVKKTCSLEEDYINYLIPDDLIGYTKKDHMNNYKFLANRRMNKFGFKKVFSDGSPLKWQNDEIGANISTEANFFEKHVREYQTGSTIMSTFDE